MNVQLSTHPGGGESSPSATPIATSTQREGRFAERVDLKATRLIYRWLCRFFPSTAAHLAYRQLATPPATSPGRWHSALRASALSRPLAFGKGHLEVYEWGYGPTILFVHGWGADAMHMGRMVQPLVRAGFRVVAFDAPAHGLSSGRRTDMVEFASAIAAVAQEVGPLHSVIGHSFGAAMSLFAARDWGVETKRIVLISSFSHCIWLVDMFAKHVGLDAEVHKRVLDLFVQRYSGRFDWGRMSVVEMARQASLPILLVHDKSDAEIPFDHALSLAAAMPDAQVKFTKGLGHHKILRNREVIRCVLAFLFK